VSLQQIIERGLKNKFGGRALPPHMWRAAERITACRTAALGGHVQACPEEHMERHWYNSCKHRSCPLCAFTSVERWLDRQKARVLGCDYYHVIITVDSALNSLWLANVRAMTDILFQAAKETIFELLGDPKYLGAEPGMTIALHTWGQMQGLHPHVHCLITGGGLRPDGTWRAVNNGYLLPGRVARDLFRGKFIAAVRHQLEQGKLAVPPTERLQQVLNLLNKLGRKKWNVCIRERYAHANGVLTYLGRYMRGGSIANRRIVAWDEETVKFRYKDYREDDGKKHKEMELSLNDFVRRVLLHVPEPGQKVVRSYGILAGSRRADLNRCRELLGQGPVQETEVRSWQECVTRLGDNDPSRCPVCGARLVQKEVFRPDFRGVTRKFPLQEAA
jgi:putative transposase/transposase-like zinc-binding protein